MIVIQFLAVMVIGYLLGSIPFGVLVGRLGGRADIRDYGSGKTGATNVLRTVGRKAAVLVVVLDMFKGALAALVAILMFGEDYPLIHVAAALMAITGHIWPVFLKFRGGRGVATFFGGLAALSLPAAVGGGIILLVGVGLTRFASVGSIAGAIGGCAVLVSLTIWGSSPAEYLVYALIGTLLLIIMHRDNIGRLMAGTERKIGGKTVSVNSSNSAHHGD